MIRFIWLALLIGGCLTPFIFAFRNFWNHSMYRLDKLGLPHTFRNIFFLPAETLKARDREIERLLDDDIQFAQRMAERSRPAPEKEESKRS